MVWEPLVVLAGETVPQVAEHAAPFCVRLQFTPLFPTSFVTVAVNCCVPFTGTFADAGEIETESPWTVIVAEAEWLGSATEVAVTVTIAGEFGAV